MSSDNRTFGAVQSCALERGFELQHRTVLTPTRKGYPIYWRDCQCREQRDAVAALSDVEAFITQKIANGEAPLPGRWYVSWLVRDFGGFGEGFEPWCRYRQWVQPLVSEGLIPKHYMKRGSVDPTPYASAAEALATVSMLGLELGTRLSLGAQVGPLSNQWHILRTSAWSEAAIEELLIDYVRYNNPEGVAPDEGALLEEKVSRVSGVAREDVGPVVERLIAEGRLVRGVYGRGTTPEWHVIRVCEKDEAN